MGFNALYGVGSHSLPSTADANWFMDQASGNCIDRSANANNLVPSYGVPTFQVAGPDPLVYGIALPGGFCGLLKNGTASGTIGRNASAITIEAWVKYTVSGAWAMTVVFGRVGFSTRFRLYTHSGKIGFAVRSGDAEAEKAVSTTATYNSGTWRHVVATADFAADEMLIYVDGVAVSTTGATDFVSSVTGDTATTNLSVGFLGGPNDVYTGSVANVAVRRVVLDSDDVGESYAGPELVNTVAPVLSGDAEIGGTLSVTNGTWALPSPFTAGFNGTPSYTYRWTRSDDESGTNETDIPGATNNTYSPTAADAEKFLRPYVRGHNDGGYDEAADTPAAMSSQIPPLTLLTNLHAHWRLNEASGGTNVADAIDNDNDGTVPSGVITSAPGPASPDHLGFTFNGTDNDVTAGQTIGSAYPFSMACWCRPTVGALMHALSLCDSVDNDYYWALGVTAAGNWVVTRRDGGTEVATDTGVAAADGDWQHVAVVFKSTTEFDLYVGPALVYEGTGLTAVAGSSSHDRFSIGALRVLSPTQRWVGDLDEVRLYSRELVLSDVVGLSSLGLDANLALSLKLGESSGTLAVNEIMPTIITDPMDSFSAHTDGELPTGTTHYVNSNTTGDVFSRTGDTEAETLTISAATGATAALHFGFTYPTALGTATGQHQILRVTYQITEKTGSCTFRAYNGAWTTIDTEVGSLQTVEIDMGVSAISSLIIAVTVIGASQSMTVVVHDVTVQAIAAATYEGSPVLDQPGKMGRAVEMTGTQHVNCKSHPSHGGDASFSAWLKTDTAFTGRIMSNRDGSNNGWDCYLFDDGRIGLFSNYIHLQIAGFWPFDGAWTHLVITRSTAGTAFYRNGVLISSSPTSNPLDASSANLLLGRYAPSATSFYDGLMQHVRFYNRVLAAWEARHLFQQPSLRRRSLSKIRSDGMHAICSGAA